MHANRLLLALSAAAAIGWACQSAPRAPFERGDAFAAVGLLFES